MIQPGALIFTPGERSVFRRRERISVSTWAARHIIVKDGPHAGGRIRLDYAPYLAGIMDAWGDPFIEEVIVAGGPQTGKTLAMYSCMAFAVDYRPAPRMLAMPDDETLGKAAEKKLLPLFRSCAPVRRILGRDKAGLIEFLDGTNLFLSSSQSPSQRATISIRDLFLDEEDLYKSIQGKGDPVSDFLERTRSYAGMRKVMRVSKPVGGEESSILRAMDSADERRQYEARCPACSVHQVMRPEQLVILDRCTDPAEVKRRRLGRYACAFCNYLWTDHARDQAVSAGRWRASKPVDRPRSVAFHLPSILSRAVSISEICAAKLLAEAPEAKQEDRQAYANRDWAEPYRPVAISVESATVLERVIPGFKPRTMPRAAVALTAGIDVQARGFWYVVRAWALNLESWLVDYGFLATWDAVEHLIFETWWPVEETGEVRQIWRAAIDSGGTKEAGELVSRTEEVYQFVRAKGRGVLYATKGASRPQIRRVRSSVIDRLPSGPRIPGGLELYMLDPFALKGLVLSRFSSESTQAMHLHEETGNDYAEQLTAEHLVIGKGSRREWKRIRKANHFLDCECLAAACADPEWAPGLQLSARLMGQQKTERPRPNPDHQRPGGRPSWFSNR